MPNKIELKGRKFGRLTVIEQNPDKGIRSELIWNCLCACGNIVSVRGLNLRSGHTKSCGCLQIEATKNIEGNHNMSKSKFYRTWESMKRRCMVKTADDYDRYGGRGIKVCKRWMDFSNFKEDLYSSYLVHCKKYGEKETTIDRIDNNGSYEPKNVRWATYKVQSRNKRNSRLLRYKGKLRTLAYWSERSCINYATIYDRLKRGWSVKKSLETLEKTIRSL